MLESEVLMLLKSRAGMWPKAPITPDEEESWKHTFRRFTYSECVAGLEELKDHKLTVPEPGHLAQTIFRQRDRVGGNRNGMAAPKPAYCGGYAVCVESAASGKPTVGDQRTFFYPSGQLPSQEEVWSDMSRLVNSLVRIYGGGRWEIRWEPFVQAGHSAEVPDVPVGDFGALARWMGRNKGLPRDVQQAGQFGEPMSDEDLMAARDQFLAAGKEV